MLTKPWRWLRVHLETFRQYRAAVVTAEALVWHHGYKGLNARTEGGGGAGGQPSPGGPRRTGRAVRGGSLYAVQAGRRRSACSAPRWSHRRGQMIYAPEVGPERSVPVA